MNTSLSMGCLESSSIVEMSSDLPISDLLQGTMTRDLGASWLPRTDMPEITLSFSGVVFATSVGACVSTVAGCAASVCFGVAGAFACAASDCCGAVACCAKTVAGVITKTANINQ